MRVYHLKCSLIALCLWNHQGFGAEAEKSSVGTQDRPLTPRELDVLDQKGLLPDPEPEVLIPSNPEDETPEIETRLFRHSNGYRQGAGEIAAFTEEGLYEYRKQILREETARRVRWNLGISREYDALLALSLREQTQWQRHLAAYDLTAAARAFKGQGATLDEIYQSAYRSGSDFKDYLPRESQRIEGGLKLGDTMRVGRMSEVSVTAEARADKTDFEDAIEDTSTFQAITLSSVLGLSRSSRIETLLRRSLVSYEDERANLTQSQDINEAELSFFSRVSTNYDAGFGFRTIDGKRNGPMLTLLRRPDERWSATGRISYLKGEGDDQILGTFESRFRYTRLLTLNLRAEQGIDLLQTYSNLSVSGQPDIREQRTIKSYSLGASYRGKRSEYDLTLLSARQDYQSSSLTQDELRFVVSDPFTVNDTLLFTTSLRHFTEEGEVIRTLDRRQFLVDLGFRHKVGSGMKVLGPRHFFEAGASYERLWEGSRERDREIFRIALGQEY